MYLYKHNITGRYLELIKPGFKIGTFYILDGDFKRVATELPFSKKRIEAKAICKMENVTSLNS